MAITLSDHGDAVHIAGPLWVESTGYRWPVMQSFILTVEKKNSGVAGDFSRLSAQSTSMFWIKLISPVILSQLRKSW